MSATAAPVPLADRRPIAIAATTVTGVLALDALGRPGLSTVTAQGAPGAPVQVTPAYDAPSDERFKLTADGARFDAVEKIVTLLGPAPLLSRGDERVTARSARYFVERNELHLEEGVRGRMYMRLSEEPDERLVDFSSNRALVRLKPGGGGEDAITAVDALGALRLRRSDGAIDVTGDALHYTREADGRWVQLEGKPLGGRFGAHALSGGVVRFPLPDDLGKPKKTDANKTGAKEPGVPASTLGTKEK